LGLGEQRVFGKLGRDDEEKLGFRHLENGFLGSLMEYLEGKEL